MATWTSHNTESSCQGAHDRARKARRCRRTSMVDDEHGWRTRTLSGVGRTLRDATKFVTEEPLPTEMGVLLMELERAEEERAKQSHNLPHWTSDREQTKK